MGTVNLSEKKLVKPNRTASPDFSSPKDYECQGNDKIRSQVYVSNDIYH